MIRLRVIEVVWLFVLKLVVFYFVEVVSIVEEQVQCVFCDSVIMKIGVGVDCNFGGIEVGVEYVIGVSCERLDLMEVFYVWDSIFEVFCGVGLGDEEFCVNEFFGDFLFYIVRVK